MLKEELKLIDGRKEGITREFADYKHDDSYHKLHDEKLARQNLSKYNLLVEENTVLKQKL